MKLTRHPWFIPVAGALALAFEAWASSPFEMLVIGLPWYVFALIYLLLIRLPERPVPAQAGATTRIILSVIGVLATAFAIYVIWGRITDTGLVGWLDAVQARGNGRYSEKLSLVVAFIYLGDVIGLLYVASRWFQPARTATAAHSANGPAARAGATAPRPPATKINPSPIRTVAIVFGCLLPAVWIVGFVIYQVVAARHDHELHAHYASVDLAVPASARSAEFIALRGQPHASGYVTLGRQYSNDKIAFLPIVARGAPAGTAVHWIVKSDEAAVRTLPPIVFAHARGEAVAPIVREGLQKMGVPLAPDVAVVDYVETRDGKVVDRAARDREWLLLGAGSVTVIVLLLWLTTTLLLWRQDRKKPGAAPRGPMRA